MIESTPVFNPKEKQLLSHFFSNLNKPVFTLKNMPEVLKGALFSRYSRSSLPLRELFLKDYIDNEEIKTATGFKNLEKDINKYESALEFLNTDKAQAFYEKWLAMYGDDSIAELGGIHIGIENISVLATKSIEERRIGISPLEKSTRYVRFDDKIGNKYKYYRDPQIMNSKYANAYIKALDNAFDTYAKLIEPMKEFYIKKFPKPADVSENAYNSSIKAKACDILRGLLPTATLTNMGIFANGRAVEYLLTKMYTFELDEVKDYAKLIHKECKETIENFVKRIEGDKGNAYINYLVNTENTISNLSKKLIKGKKINNTQSNVQLIEYEKDAQIKAAASILYASSNISYKDIYNIVRDWPVKRIDQVINSYVENRLGRWHKVGKAFEDIYYTFEIISDFGAYKDLQRHRLTTMFKQKLTTELGYEIPSDIVEAKYETEYKKAFDLLDKTYKKISVTYPQQAQYLVAHGHLVRWKIKMNLREVFHFCELRSSPQGHPSYRKIAQEIYLQIKKIHPIIGASIKFVSMEDPGLERLSAEVRKEDKLKMLNAK